MKRAKRERASRPVEARARREFAKTLAALAATPVVSFSGAARAQEPADAVSSSADALTQVVRARYGKYLKEDQVTEVRRSIERGIRNADRLKQVKLNNGDEPAFAFSADFE